MTLRFFRRLKIAPGLTLNVSRSGPSVSVGRRGAHVTVGPRGVTRTIGIPGTGARWTETQPWRCTHEGIGLPGCPTCDVRTISEGGPRPDATP